MGLGILLLGYFMMLNSTIGTENLSIDISLDAVGVLLMVSGGIMLKSYSDKFRLLFRCAAVMVPLSIFFTVYQLKLWDGFEHSIFPVLYRVCDLGWIILLYGLQRAVFGGVGKIASDCELFILEARLKICERIGLFYAVLAVTYWTLCFAFPTVFEEYSYYIRYLLYDLIVFFQTFYLFKAWREIAFV